MALVSMDISTILIFLTLRGDCLPFCLPLPFLSPIFYIFQYTVYASPLLIILINIYFDLQSCCKRSDFFST